MAFVDGRALVGRPSLRRALASMDETGQAAFQSSVGDIDPKRFKRLYRQRANQFVDQERELSAFRNRDLLQQREEEKRSLYRAQNFGMSSGGQGQYYDGTMRRSW